MKKRSKARPSLRYRFRQHFRAPAAAAFAWCTDFRASDASYLDYPAVRSVRWLAPDAVILTDRAHRRGRLRRISRLVRIFPEKMAWTNTHLEGPYRHSQFWYRIVPEGPQASRLEFDGLQLEAPSYPISEAQRRRRAAAERAADARFWRRKLAPALEAEWRGSDR